MSGNHIQTTMHNVEFLGSKCQLKKCGNRALFKKDSQFYISPAVAKNSQGYYWFDIRQATLDYISKFDIAHCKIIIRIVPDLFIYIEWTNMDALLENPKIEKTGLMKWEFLLQKSFTIVKNRNSEAQLSVHPLNKQEFEFKFNGNFLPD